MITYLIETIKLLWPTRRRPNRRGVRRVHRLLSYFEHYNSKVRRNG